MDVGAIQSNISMRIHRVPASARFCLRVVAHAVNAPLLHPSEFLAVSSTEKQHTLRTEAAVCGPLAASQNERGGLNRPRSARKDISYRSQGSSSGRAAFAESTWEAPVVSGLKSSSRLHLRKSKFVCFPSITSSPPSVNMDSNYGARVVCSGLTTPCPRRKS